MFTYHSVHPKSRNPAMMSSKLKARRKKPHFFGVRNGVLVFRSWAPPTIFGVNVSIPSFCGEYHKDVFLSIISKELDGLDKPLRGRFSLNCLPDGAGDLGVVRLNDHFLCDVRDISSLSIMSYAIVNSVDTG
jgi:hypothetical protein